MTTLIKIVFILLFFGICKSFALDIYVASLSQGTGDGSSSINPISWESYGAGTIGGLNPGDTLHIVGTITNSDPIYHITFLIQCNGLPGNPITFKFEPNAMISLPNGNPFSLQNQHDIVIDGGTNGIVQDTATGSGMTYSNEIAFISASGASNLTVKNLKLLNSYIHTNILDSNTGGGGGVIYANGFGGTGYFLNDTFSNSCWCLTILATTCSLMVVSNCSFYNYDHGVVPNNPTNIVIENCHFDSTSNWDTVANSYHHDCIHYFAQNNDISFVIQGNIFTNSMGSNNNTMIYLETAPPNVLMYNNLFLQYPNNYLNDGMVVCNGTNCQFFNNTFAGSGVVNSTALVSGGTNDVMVNNLYDNLTTFISLPSGTGFVFSNNIYANAVAGGNLPWGTVSGGYSTFLPWKSAMNDVNSIYTNSMIINSDGSIPTGSPVIGLGANLFNIFNVDYLGTPRPSTRNWTVGAYEVPFVMPTPFYFPLTR